MFGNFSRSLGKLGCTIVATVLGVQAAQADSIKLTSETFSNGSQAGTIWATSPSVSESASIGRFLVTGTNQTTNQAVSYTSYCVDISQFLGDGIYTLQTLASSGLMSTTKQTQLNALIANGDPLVNDATTSAAMQLAVWEIQYESAANPFSFTAGNFGANGSGITSALSLASTYLGKVTSGAWAADSNLRLSVLTSGSLQDQLVFSRVTSPPSSASAVPEPASWAMMIVGFGVIGAAARRQRAIVPAIG